MRTRSCIAVAMIAGTALSSTALAQKSARPPSGRQPEMRLGAAVPQRAVPDMIRSVRMVKGHVEPLSDWVPYHAGTSSTDTSNQYVFDAIQTDPGVIPGTQPLGGRYYFEWAAGTHDYTTAIRTFDMVGIPAAAQGQGAKVVDFLFYENNGTQPLFITIFTAETFNAAVAPPDPSWGIFPGIQLAFNQGAGNGFWYSTADVSTQLPPVGDGWKMPVDGSGAYIFQYTRDAGATQPALGVQPGCWATGNYAQPAVARVGTQGNVGHADDSSTAACATSLATNVPNLVVLNSCEFYSWSFPTIPAPDPTVLAPAIGFGMKLQGGVTGACCTNGSCTVTSQATCVAGGGVYQGDNSNCATTVCPSPCYPNCDASTIVPCLNVQDFGCFLNKFANQDSYANCDNSTIPPVLNVQDFGCFLNKFAIGCSGC